MKIEKKLIKKVRSLILNRRVELSLTKRSVAYACNIDESLLGKFEKGYRRLSLEDCMNICMYLNCYSELITIIRKEGENNGHN